MIILPFIGWLLAFLLAFCGSIPFYFLWNYFAPTYFGFLPAVYHFIPFWNCVGLFMLSPLVKMLVWPNFSCTTSKG